jgi:dTDP-glucose 4,6-dehydratase
MTTTILLSGIAGFLGSAYARHVLETTDWDIVGLDRIDEAASLSRIPSPHWGRIKLVWHDLRAAINPAHSEALRQKFRFVIHMAAASHVDRSVKDPMGFIMDNVVGTGNLLEFVRAMPEMPEKILHFSTDEVFGSAEANVEFGPYAAHHGMNPYAASKSAAEQLIPAWATTYGLPLIVTHCTNAYGPGQYAEKFIPLCIDRIKRDATIQIHARGGEPSSRYYIHSEDVARAVQVVLEKGGTMHDRRTGKFNIGAEEERSNLFVARSIAQVLGKELRYELVDNVASRPRHDQRYAVDSSALRALGWKEEVSFEEGLRLTIEAASVSR